MSIDLIIYAAVAFGLIAWLRTLLGTGSENGRKRIHPIVMAEQKLKETELLKASNDSKESQEIDDTIKSLPATMGVLDESKDGLKEIMNAQSDFDIRKFLTAASDVFALVSEDFANGDEEGLESLLSSHVADIFKSAIKDRQDKNQTQETEIRAIPKSEITAAWLKNRKAYITVEFTAEQVSVTKDKDDKVVAGDPLRVKETKGTWIFVHNIGDADPRWLVDEIK